MTCASEATGTASPASANENKITEEARRIPIPSRLSIVIARLRAKCREIKAHLMIVDRSREPAFVATKHGAGEIEIVTGTIWQSPPHPGKQMKLFGDMAQDHDR